MIPSIWTECLIEHPPEEAIEIIASAGFRCVELGGSTHLDAIDQDADPLSRAKQIRRVADGVGVAIDQMHGPFVNPLKADQRAQCKAIVCRTLEYASVLGARWVVLHPATVAADETTTLSAGEIMEINAEFFGGILSTAADTGIGFAIENMFDYPRSDRHRFGSTPDTLLALVETLDSDSAGICWDTGHANVQGLDQVTALKQLSGHLRAVHIADNDGTADQHSIPFRGTRGEQNMCDWTGILSTLRSIGFDGPFNLEIPGATDRIPRRLRPHFLAYAYKLCRHFCEE